MTEYTVTGGLVAALITGVTGVAAALIAFFGGRNSRVHEINKAITDGFTQLTEGQSSRIARLEGRVAQLEQHIWTLERILHDHGIPVPLPPEVGAIHIIDKDTH